MKFISIAVKDFKELVRDRRGLFFILLFPIFFMMIFGFAFGGMGEGNTPHNIAIVNYDQGTVNSTSGENVNYGNNLIIALQDANYENSSVKLFNITTTTDSQAKDLLRQRTVDAELIIPADFSNSVSALINNTLQSSTGQTSVNSSTSNNTSTVIISGDTGFMGFGVAQGILVGVLGQYQENVVNSVKNQIAGTPGAEPTKFIDTKVQSIPGTQNFTQFDFLAPGMIVFAILLLATTVAAILTREVESGTLLRLKMSKMRSFDLLFGGLIPWSLIAGAQVVILLAVGIILGLHWQGNFYSIILAIFIGIIGGVASISLAMIIASFAKTDRQAANLGTLIVIPISFLTGAFFQLPGVFLNFFGHNFQAYDLLPWTHTLTALRSVLIFGSGWNSVSYEVEMSVILTLILFVIGVFLFSRTRLSAEN
ncbi:MAG: ABC-2 transporter permease [Methanobacterium sp.]